MKSSHITLICSALAAPVLLANPATELAEPAQLTAEQKTKAVKEHSSGASNLSLEQDDLSADVQDLIDEQTHPEVIKLLQEIEIVMAEATDLLEQSNTGGATIAIETEIIEKIFDAAKKKKQQSGNGSPKEQQGMESMLEMMQRMMEGGKDVGEKQGEGQKPGPGEGQGDGPGGGGKGGGNASGKTGSPDNTNPNSQRRVPKNSGNAGSTLPREFQKAMDAYNKGASDAIRKP